MKKAFTLIELLVVIAIIGILSGLIIVGMSSATQSATIAKAQIFSNSLKNSLLMNLVGEWKFEGPTTIGQAATASDVLDSWGGNNTGIVIDQAPIVKGGNDCIYGKCLNLNSTVNFDYIHCGTGGSDLNVASGDSMTAEAWIKLDSLGTTKSIVAKWAPWIFFVNGSNRLQFYIATGSGDTSVLASTLLKVSTWYHVAVVYTKSDLRATFYLNGIKDGNPTFSLAMAGPSGNPITIGGYGNSSSRFIGTIDEVRIYNTGIPASKIKEQYYAGINNLLVKGQITNEEYYYRIAYAR